MAIKKSKYNTGVAREQRYQNREIDRMFKALDSNVTEFRAESASAFEAMIARQDKTNGNISRHDRWIYTMSGGLAVLTTIALPLLGWALWTINQL